MDPLTMMTIADAAINGVQEAVAAWPTVKALFTGGGTATPEQQAQIDAATDAAHAALQADSGPAS